MIKRYTPAQVAKFAQFCARHEIRFNTVAEYHAAIKQYFGD